MENELTCTDSRPDNINYHCSTKLKQLTQGENKFYFKCQDKSPEQFVSQEQELILIGSSELTVRSTHPTPVETTSNNDVTLTVVTTGGADGGSAICSYSLNGQFIDKMKNTGETVHTQFQQLMNGHFIYGITCEDIAGNTASTTIEFTVDVGEEAPEITPKLIHTYKQSALFIILNKQTTCEYDTQQFSFGNGNPMTEPDSTIHSAPLGFSNYFIKCRDAFDNDISPIEIIP